MQAYQHRILTTIDETGFGVKYENNLSTYIPPHWHKAVELLMFVKGRVTCNFENAKLQFKKNDIAIINSHEVHETKCTRKAVYLVVHIDPTLMCRYVPTFDQLRFSMAFDPEDKEKAEALAQIRIHMQQILRLTENETDPAGRLERHARLFALSSLLVKHFSQPLTVEETRLQRSDMARLEPLLDYIQLHHGEELPLDEAVEFMGLNKEYFCRLFKKNMGVSYIQYLNQVRAAAVCKELEISDDPIWEIGQRHGFTDPKRMNQCFRELYGCTPSEKRKFFRENRG